MIDLSQRVGATHYILHFPEDGSPPLVEQRTMIVRGIITARWKGRQCFAHQGWEAMPDRLKFHYFSSWEEYAIFEKEMASTFVSSP